jgi:hypothetical protein
MSATAQSPGKTSIGQGSVHWTSEMSEMKSGLESSGNELVAETISYKLSTRKLFLDVAFITAIFRPPLLAHSHSLQSNSYRSPVYVCQVLVHLPRTKFRYHQASN